MSFRYTDHVNLLGLSGNRPAACTKQRDCKKFTVVVVLYKNINNPLVIVAMSPGSH